MRLLVIADEDYPAYALGRNRVITFPTGHKFAVVLPDIVDANDLPEHKLTHAGYTTYRADDYTCARVGYLLSKNVKHLVVGVDGETYMCDGTRLWLA